MQRPSFSPWRGQDALATAGRIPALTRWGKDFSDVEALLIGCGDGDGSGFGYYLLCGSGGKQWEQRAVATDGVAHLAEGWDCHISAWGCDFIQAGCGVE